MRCGAVKFHFEMKLYSLQIKAARQKVHIIKSHKPVHKRKVFHSFTSERYRIHVPHCWLWHTCRDTLEGTIFCLLGTFQHQRLCILSSFIRSAPDSPQELCCFGILFLCWRSYAHQDPEAKQAACMPGNLLYSFLYTIHHERGGIGNSTQINNS